MFNLHAPYIRQKKLIDISISLPQNSLHDSQSRENLKLEKEFTQSRSERGEERGNTVKARAEIETGNEREERERETNGDRKSRKHSRSVKSLRVCMGEGGREGNDEGTLIHSLARDWRRIVMRTRLLLLHHARSRALAQLNAL